jgi:hypothetical protein
MTASTLNQARHLLELSDAGIYSTAELAELFQRRPLHGVPDHPPLAPSPD